MVKTGHEKHNSPLVSIVVPIYNVEPYIRNSMFSVVNQTYKKIEIILVDDGCQDNSVAIASEIFKAAGMTFVTIKQQNMGMAMARNTGLLHANGQWILFLDSDDILHKEAIEKMIDVASNNDVDFVFPDFETIEFDDEIKPLPIDYQTYIQPKRELMIDFLLRKIIILAPGTLFKTVILKENKLFFKNIRFSEDRCFVWDMLRVINHGANIKGVLYYYVIRSGSIMRSTKLKSILEIYPTMKEVQLKMQNDPSVPNIVKKFLLPRWVLGILRSGSRLLDKRDFPILIQEFEARKNAKILLFFPDIRIKLVALVLFFSPRLYYKIFKNHYFSR